MPRHPENWLVVQQQTSEWLQLRLGHVTSSRIADVVLRMKNGKPYAGYEDYQMELLSEVLTGRAEEHYVSNEMMFGIENEPLARTEYELAKGVEVERVGFVLHPRIPRSGASPDGCVGEDGLIEIKVPKTITHLKYRKAKVVPEEYVPQMMWQMACCERQWVDFVSYDPRLPEEFGLFIVRLERDEKIIGEMERKVEQFIAELNAMCEELQANRRVVVPPAPAEHKYQIPKAVIPEMA